jgi:tRNA(Ile)-lysidine synthase
MSESLPPSPSRSGDGAAVGAVAAALTAARAGGLLPEGGGVLVAVSGGGDSVALLHALSARGPALGVGPVVAGHVDHGLRPDSGEDARAVGGLCQSLGVPLEVRRVAVDAAPAGLQAGARRARYAALEAMREAMGAQVVATAHTADDQAETVLMRLCRGTSPAGLAAIRAQSGRVVRPLLHVSRACLAAYCASQGLSFRSDPANADPRFVRSRIRHEILPQLESVLGPGVGDALARFAALAADEDRFLRDAAAALEAGLASGGAGLDARGLAEADPALARRVVVSAWARAAGAASPPVESRHVSRLLEALGNASGWRRDLPGGVRATLSCGRLLLEGRGDETSAFPAQAIPGPGRYRPVGTPLEVLVRRRRGGVAAVVDPYHHRVPWPLRRPLTLRGWRPGDRLAKNGPKISDLFVRARIPRPLRPATPVLLVGDEVVWAAGLDAGREAVRGAALEITVRECIFGEGSAVLEG